MATRTPSLQTRSQYGNFWGIYANAAALPNVGTIAPANKIRPLEQGDIAYVVGTGFYQCDAPGVTAPPDGLAVWSSMAGAAGQDRFAPTFLVGNTAAGDSAVAYSSAGFNYYPDTGNGAQIAAALAAATASADRGRVYIRRGTYNLGAVGGPAAPLVVSSGVAVQGEGDATIITASTVNQGVFTLANTASLEQIRLTATAEATSLGSTAMVVASDSVTLGNVHLEMGTDAAGALREALRLVSTGGTPLPRLTNIRVVISTSTGGLDPSIGIRADGTVVTGRGITISGGDQALSSNNSDVSIEQLFAFDWSTNGVIHTGTGRVSINTANLVSNAATAVSAEGVVLGGSGHTLSNVDVTNTALQMTTGIRFSTTSSNHRVEGCRISGGWADGIVLGSTAGASATSNTTITNCRIEAGGYGIRAAADTNGLVVAKNQITVASGGSAAVAAGVRIEGAASAGNTVEGNRITVTDGLAAAFGIQFDADNTQSTIRGNLVTVSGGVAGIQTDGDRVVVEGNSLLVSDSTAAIIVVNGALYNTVNNNVCVTADNPYVAPILVYGGEYGTVSNNVTVVTSAAPAVSQGIQLTAASSNSNCIGNVSRGSSVAPIIDDLGTANNVAQNVGAV